MELNRGDIVIVNLYPKKGDEGKDCDEISYSSTLSFQVK